MSKTFLAFVVAFACLFGACAQTKKTAGKSAETESPGNTAPSTKSVSTKPESREITAVAMRRGACFGRCPEYTITINSDGLVHYSSFRNATPEGDFEKNLGNRARKLLKEFMTFRADTCKDRYEPKMADLPGLDYTLTINGEKKRIYNAHFGPTFLISLSNEIDGLGRVDSTWKKVSKPQPED